MLTDCIVLIVSRLPERRIFEPSPVGQQLPETRPRLLVRCGSFHRLYTKHLLDPVFIEAPVTAAMIPDPAADNHGLNVAGGARMQERLYRRDRAGERRTGDTTMAHEDDIGCRSGN